MPMSGATLEQKNGILEFTKLEYHKKWYFPIYFPNSVSGLNILKINVNGSFYPKIQVVHFFRYGNWHTLIQKSRPIELEDER